MNFGGMMNTLLLPDAIEQYIAGMTTPETPALAQLNRETHLKVDKPNMLSGHLQGALLSMMSQMIAPACILEIGTYTGYSAICLAQGLQEGGQLHTIDIDEELADMAHKYWQAAGVDQLITAHIGKAAEIIPTLDMAFDLVFIDADKAAYPLYFDLVFEQVRPGGFILADNVLYKGGVVLPPEEQHRNAKAMHIYNEKIKNDHRVDQVLLPIRDGILIARKLA